MNEQWEQKIRSADRANTNSDWLQKSKRGTMKTENLGADEETQSENSDWLQKSKRWNLRASHSTYETKSRTPGECNPTAAAAPPAKQITKKIRTDQISQIEPDCSSKIRIAQIQRHTRCNNQFF
jgi:hypothetical protein